MKRSANLSEFSPEHRAMIEQMKNQLLIVLINRLGGSTEIPVSEIDGTGKFNLTMKLDAENKIFEFTVVNKEGH